MANNQQMAGIARTLGIREPLIFNAFVMRWVTASENAEIRRTWRRALKKVGR